MVKNQMTNGVLLKRGLELLAMLKEDMSHMGAEDLHQLQCTWERNPRLLASESVTRHMLFSEETRWPGYYYRGDLKDALALVDVKVLDHFIVAGTSALSFAERGLL